MKIIKNDIYLMCYPFHIINVVVVVVITCCNYLSAGGTNELIE